MEPKDKEKESTRPKPMPGPDESTGYQLMLHVYLQKVRTWPAAAAKNMQWSLQNG